MMDNENKDKNKDFPIKGLWEILKGEYEREWLVEGLIPHPGLTAVSGHPGSFKSWIVMELARATATGGKFLQEFDTKKGNVLLIDNENDEVEHNKRFNKLGFPEDNTSVFCYDNKDGLFYIDEEGMYKPLIKLIEEKDISLVIFDSLRRIHRGEENESRAAAEVMNRMKQLTSRDVTVVFTHHHRKGNSYAPDKPGQSMRGSSDIGAAIDAHLAVYKKSNSSLVVKQPQLRYGKPADSFRVKVKSELEGSEEVGVTMKYAGEYDDTTQKIKKAKEAVGELLKEINEPIGRKDIVESLKDDCGRNNVDKAIKLLEDSGEIEKLPKDERPDKKKHAHIYKTLE